MNYKQKDRNNCGSTIYYWDDCRHLCKLLFMGPLT